MLAHFVQNLLAVEIRLLLHDSCSVQVKKNLFYFNYLKNN